MPGAEPDVRGTLPLARWSAVAIIAIAGVRAATSILPQVRFDTDPALNPTGSAAFGPTGSFVLDALLLAAASLGLLAERRAGRRVDGVLVALAALPTIPILWHGSADAMDLFRGTTWIAAACAAVTAAHLGRDPELRRLLLAGAAAIAAPLALRGTIQLTVEHAQTVAFFRENRDAFFAERGWTAGGPAANAFERRLLQAEASGWFGLANLFSAVMAFGALTLGGLAVAARSTRWLLLTLLAVAAACATLLALNGSKGALGATALGLAVMAVGWRTRSRSVATWCAFAVIAAAALAPLARGLLGEDFAGERSLLFRWHYLVGATRALPEALPIGLGPDGFQDAYLRVKPERSPEDVVSAHAMVVDWLVLLGPLGLAWAWMLLRLLRPRPSGDAATATEGGGSPLNDVVRAFLLVGVIILAAQAIAERPIADPAWLVSRLLGLALLVITGVAAVLAQRRSPAWAVAAIGLGAVTAILTQAQIEMLLFQPGTPVWVMLAVGAVGGVAVRHAATTDDGARGAIPVAIPGAIGLAVLVLGVFPQWRQDRLLDQAAAIVMPLADVRERWPAARAEIAAGAKGPSSGELIALLTAQGSVEAASGVSAAIASGGSAEDRVDRAVTALRRFDASLRAKAAETLEEADRASPSSRVAIEAAIKQLAAAGRRVTGQRGGGIADPLLHTTAIELATDYADGWTSPRSAAMLADLWLERVRAQPDPTAIAEALRATARAVELQPRSATRRVDLGDLLAASGSLGPALNEFRRALAIDADLALDPLAQFPERVRRDVERRIGLLEEAERTGTLPAGGWPLR